MATMVVARPDGPTRLKSGSSSWSSRNGEAFWRENLATTEVRGISAEVTLLSLCARRLSSRVDLHLYLMEKKGRGEKVAICRLRFVSRRWGRRPQVSSPQGEPLSLSHSAAPRSLTHSLSPLLTSRRRRRRFVRSRRVRARPQGGGVCPDDPAGRVKSTTDRRTSQNDRLNGRPTRACDARDRNQVYSVGDESSLVTPHARDSPGG